jgi:hypothetical protein
VYAVSELLLSDLDKFGLRVLVTSLGMKQHDLAKEYTELVPDDPFECLMAVVE